MKVRFLATIVTASALSVVYTTTAHSNPNLQTTQSNSFPVESKLKVCAGKNPCAGKNSASEIFIENGVAVRGTDVVAYFNQGKAVAGSTKYALKWKGAIWRFSSAANQNLFAKNPAKFAPQYGGYCAKAVSEGNLAPTDPQAWKIVNGKLYLNYDKTVQAEWLQDVPGNIAKANRNWPGVLARR
jgi:YHS domain-containing protein